MKTTIVLHGDIDRLRTLLNTIESDLTVGIDPIQMTEIGEVLADRGITVIECPFTPSSPMATIHRALREGPQ